MRLNRCWVFEKARLKVIWCADVYRSFDVASLELEGEAAINNYVSSFIAINNCTFSNKICKSFSFYYIVVQLRIIVKRLQLQKLSFVISLKKTKVNYVFFLVGFYLIED